MNDTLRVALLAVFVAGGAYWQVNEIRYWRAVRRHHPPRPFTLRIRIRRTW